MKKSLFLNLHTKNYKPWMFLTYQFHLYLKITKHYKIIPIRLGPSDFRDIDIPPIIEQLNVVLVSALALYRKFYSLRPKNT